MNNYRGLQLQLKALRELGYYSGSLKLRKHNMVDTLFSILNYYLKHPDYKFVNIKENLMYWLYKVVDKDTFDAKYLQETLKTIHTKVYYNSILRTFFGIHIDYYPQNKHEIIQELKRLHDSINLPGVVYPEAIDIINIIEYDFLMYEEPNFKIITHGTCMICYESNNDKMYQLKCHDKHILCKECFHEMRKCPIDNTSIYKLP
jgi:hypothetical protein